MAFGLALFTDPSEFRIVLAKVQYIGIVIVPTAWLTFAIQYTGRRNWLNAKTIPLLAVMPIAILALVWTNGSHHLIWATIEFDVTGDLSLLNLTYGNAFWVHTVYSYVAMLAGILIVAEDIFYSHCLFWQQSAAMLVSAITPWVANWLFFIEAGPVENLDPTPFAFLASVAVLWWTVYRVRLLDITPVALKAIFENITSGVIGLDELERVVASNEAAKAIVGQPGLETIGRPLKEVWPSGASMLHTQVGEPTTYPDVVFEDEPEVREVQRRLLEKDPRLTVIGEASSGEEALESVCNMAPDVITMDLLMPGMDGLEATRRIKDSYPDIKVVVVSAYGGEYLQRSVDTGADGYVLKSLASTALAERLLEVMKQ